MVNLCKKEKPPGGTENEQYKGECISMDKKCFIVCPIGNEGSETRNRSDTVLDCLLKEVCESFNYEVVRCDKISSDGRIDAEIINNLETAELVITDLTELNANVFYETGYRKAKGLPCIHIAQEGVVLPFDVTTVRTLFYNINDLRKSEKFKETLKSTIESVESRVASNANDKDEIANENGSPMEQKVLDMLYNLEDSIKSFYDLIEGGLVDIDRRIDECCNSHQSTQEEQMTQALTEVFVREAMKNPLNAKRFITMFQNLDLSNNSKI